MTKITAATAAALALIAGQTVFADSASLPFLSPLFTDNMVLQRGVRDPIWGWTTPGQKVSVEIAGRKAIAVAESDGKWQAMLPPLPAGGPYTLSVSGPQSVRLGNVLVGDVWVCSGQSNMEFGVGNLDDPQKVIDAADYPEIRLYRVDDAISLTPSPTAVGQWKVCTPDNLRSDGDWGGFSAVAYFFGRDLYRNLHVPIGLIHSSWGGTPGEAWTSEIALRAHMPDFLPQLAALDQQVAGNRGRSRQETVDAWYAKFDPGTGASPPWQSPDLDVSAWKTMNLPGYFQKAGDPALAGKNGIIWFRRQFDLPAGAAGNALTLHMLADDNDTTWVNGSLVGQTEGYDIPRAYAIPASLLRPTGNTIAVRVLDTGGLGGIYGEAGGLALDAPDGSSIPLAGPWLYRFSADYAAIDPYPVAMDKNPNYPSVLFNGMINPLIPYGMKGVVWDQGESNTGMSYQYRTLLPTLIDDWRSRWGSTFPFLIVQLAAWQQPPAHPGNDGWAELREAQWDTAATVPNCGIATAIDIGDAEDIHPKNKKELGRRLALVARRLVYHERIQDYGPAYKSMAVEGSHVRISFDHASSGLTTQGGGAPAGFAICGADRVWHWADAAIDGDSVSVWSDKVPSPVAVRYAWAAGPIGNMAAKDGLPMFPFRTDSFPEMTDWKHQGG